MSDKEKLNHDLYARLGEIGAEVKRAMEKFPTWPSDPLHALAVLGEEYGELNKAVLQACYDLRPLDEDHLKAIREEAVQTAAMALRFLLSLNDGRYVFSAGIQHDQNMKPRA